MNVWEVLGWVGNGGFFLRFLVQWLASERAGRSVAPPLFWWISIVGTVALGSYAVHEREWLLLVGYAINGLIYARNLSLGGESSGGLSTAKASLLALAALACVSTACLLELGEANASAPSWIIVGGAGQMLWSGRFIVQWWYSERRRESHFPALFWWLSLAGNVLLLAYTLHLGKTIFWIGYVLNPIVQVRNLMLGRGDKAKASA